MFRDIGAIIGMFVGGWGGGEESSKLREVWVIRKISGKRHT